METMETGNMHTGRGFSVFLFRSSATLDIGVAYSYVDTDDINESTVGILDITSILGI